jgi:hypothetical protein
MSADNIPTNTIAETQNYIVWTSEEPDGEVIYHIEFGPMTLHFFQEEWDEVQDLIKTAGKAGK